MEAGVVFFWLSFFSFLIYRGDCIIGISSLEKLL